MHPLIDTLEHLVRQAQETWEDEATQQKIRDAKARLAEMIRKNPVGSVGVALAAGFLIGKLTQRGKKE
ncbi:hypothetical protein QA596_01645 [Balneolales bacterium ANBcel1]|nr:hypothetical protein [Balneolales bacterium ANBcel1]